MAIIEDTNRFLDRMPVAAARHSGRLSPFLLCAFVGVAGAVAVDTVLGLVVHLPLLTLTGAIVVMLAVLAGWGLARPAVLRGAEQLVLLEHCWLVLTGSACLAVATGARIAPVLDVMASGLCVLFATARVGCYLVGCCHGPASFFGVAYPSVSIGRGIDRKLVGVRLFPVALVESFGLFALGAAAVSATVTTRPGSAFLTVVVGYSALRLCTEPVRADDRPRFARIAVPIWMSLANLLVAGLLARHWAVGLP